MQVTNNPLMADMQKMIAEMRSHQKVTQVAVSQPSEPKVEAAGQASRADFGKMLKSAIDNVNSLQMNSQELQNRIEMGDPNVSIADGMIASQKAGIAFEAAVQVRNKFVEAYEKIMQMPV